MSGGHLPQGTGRLSGVERGIGSPCLLAAWAPLNSAPMKRAPRVGRPTAVQKPRARAVCWVSARAALVVASEFMNRSACLACQYGKPIHLSAAGSREDADALCTERP